MMGWLGSLQNACIFYRKNAISDIQDPEVKEVIRHSAFKSYETHPLSLKFGVPAGIDELEAEEDKEEVYEEGFPKMAEEEEDDDEEGSPLKKVAKTG